MEQTGIKRLVVPAGWALVAMLALDQLSMLVVLIGQRSGLFFDSRGNWSYAVLALVVALAILWAQVGSAARTLVIAALGVSATGLVLALVFWVVTMVQIAASVPTASIVIYQLLALFVAVIVPGLALVVLYRLLQLAPAVARAESQPAALPASPDDKSGGQAPVWQPDRAAGAHWHTAGAAAQGGTADWGRPGAERGGWAPAADETQQRAPVAHEPRDPQDFGPRAIPPSSPGTHEAGEDVTRVSPVPRHGLPPVEDGTVRRPMDFGPQAVAQRFADPDDEDITRVAPPEARRKAPQWTPLEDRTQPPPSES